MATEVRNGRVSVTPSWESNQLVLAVTVTATDVYYTETYSKNINNLRIKITQNNNSMTYNTGNNSISIEWSPTDNENKIYIPISNLLSGGIKINSPFHCEITNLSDQIGEFKYAAEGTYEYVTPEGTLAPTLVFIEWTGYYISYVDNDTDVSAMPETILSGNIFPHLKIEQKSAEATYNCGMYASYQISMPSESIINVVKYSYDLLVKIGDNDYTKVQNTTNGKVSSDSLNPTVTTTDMRVSSVNERTQVRYKLVIYATPIVMIDGNNYTLNSQTYTSDIVTKYVYPKLDGDVKLLGTVTVNDIGDNKFIVNISNTTLSSVMHYTPINYYVTYDNQDFIITNNYKILNLSPTTVGVNDVNINVYATYKTLEQYNTNNVSNSLTIGGGTAVWYTPSPTPNSPILTQVNDKTFTETPDKASRKANLKYTITSATSDESVDAYNIITHLLTKDDNGNELKYYIKLDKALNPHFVQSGTKQYDGTNFSDDAYGGFVQTQVDSTNITGHYPLPLERLNKPLWREDGTSNIQYVEWNGNNYYDVSNNGSLDATKIHIIRWGGGVATQLSDCPIEHIENRGNSESDPIQIKTPSELAYLIQVRNSSTDTMDWTYGKYFKISDEIDAFDMNGHQQITLESTASEIKSLYTDTLYNIHPDDYCGNRSQYNWYNSVAPTEKGESIDCHCFSGTLDGNGCIIYNLYSAGTYSCLFPFIGVGATIKNIVLSNSRLWCWTSANSVNGASGLLWGHMDNAEALRDDDNKNITISNCVIKDCYSNSNGTSLHHIGGTLRFVDMNISDCICADNILEICDKNTDGTTIDNLYIWGGLLGGARKAGWTCHIDRCIVVGDDVHPLQICEHNTLNYVYKDDDEDHRVDDDAEWYENGPLYHHDGDGESSDMVYRMVFDLPSNCYSNCYATNKVSESTEFATYLLPSQMKDDLCVKFIDTTIYDKWYLPEVSNDTQLIDASLIVQIDLSNGVEVFNDDGTTKKYEIQSGDIIYLEVIPSIYNHGGYYTATSNSDCLSGNTTLKGAYIYVKLKDDSGNEYYKYCPIYVKTENGYVEGIDTYKKNGNAYVLGI